MATIGLCMIVKNEAQVIVRCLDSLRRLLDFVLIEDTGSTDGTQDIIREWLANTGIPGMVAEEPWHDFAWNRSDALAKLREYPAIDYAFMIDADDRIDFDEGFDVEAFKESLTADYYDIPIHHGSIRHSRPHIYRNSVEFFYRGVLHEFLESPPGQWQRDVVSGLHMTIIGGGGRSQDTEKFQRDAEALERALDTETDPFLISRYTFYLAQSYKDFGANEQALAKYLAREGQGFWDDEIYVALNEAAQLQAALDWDENEVIATYERAIAKVPHRAEAYHGASEYCFKKGLNPRGYEIAKRGLPLTEAGLPDGLFIEPWVYQYGLLDEYAINAYWSGHYRDSLNANVRILRHPNCPPDQQQRFLDNIKYAADKLNEGLAIPVYERERVVATQAPGVARDLRSVVSGPPKILLAILAKQKEAVLPFYLECLEALDYPKEAIHVYIRTNNNTDRTTQILRDWTKRVSGRYASMEMDDRDVDAPVEQFGVHEWNETRFSVLGEIRNVSLAATARLKCDYYFVPDVDNFLRPRTLRELVALGLPIAAPLLRHVNPENSYGNYHAGIDANGYFADHELYFPLLYQDIKGVCEVPVVHCTYLVRADVIPDLSYDDGSERYEYVIFSASARDHGIPQYIDTRQVYGYLTMEETADGARALIGGEVAAALEAGERDWPWLRVLAAAGPRRHAGDSVDSLVPASQSKRYIRLKEFEASSVLVHVPPDWYLSERDASLAPGEYKMTTDADGFILSGAAGRDHRRKIVVIGDSVVESMFVNQEARFCAKMEGILCEEMGLDVRVLNAGYGGATSLHSFNTLLNKLIPMKPAAVILMTGIVDVDVAFRKAGFWSNDCWIEPIIDSTANNTWRDHDVFPEPAFEDRTRILTLFDKAAQLFDIPLYYATVPHRQVFGGEYVEKCFNDRQSFDHQVRNRRLMNEVTRRVAFKADRPLVDLELALAPRSDIFHDMFHLNPVGSEAVARELLAGKMGEMLSEQIVRRVLRRR